MNEDVKKLEEAATKKPEGKFITPEGYEEDIIHELHVVATQTPNGSFRLFMNGDSVPLPSWVTTREKLRKIVGSVVATHAGMLVDPIATLEALFKLKS